MLAKLSVLALFASLASALHLSVPFAVQIGTSVDIDVTFADSDPAVVGLVLIGTNVHLDLLHDVDVAAHIHAHIPVQSIRPGPGYVIAAIEVGHPTIVYAQSNAFDIEASVH